MGRVLLTCAVGLGTLLTGCATKSDVRELEEELLAAMRRQEQMIQALQAVAEATRDSVSANRVSLFDLQGTTNRRLNDVQEQIITVLELAGVNQRQLAAMRDQLESSRRPTTAAPGVMDMPDAGPADPSDEARQTFDAGVTVYNRGSLGTARQAFRQFLTQYPSHSLAPDAQYYLGDISVQEGNLEQAIEEFNRIPELYPSAERVPAAIYRVGLLQVDMGDTDAAIISFERVVNTYPDSDVAMLAQERLGELR